MVLYSRKQVLKYLFPDKHITWRKTGYSFHTICNIMIKHLVCKYTLLPVPYSPFLLATDHLQIADIQQVR